MHPGKAQKKRSTVKGALVITLPFLNKYKAVSDRTRWKVYITDPSLYLVHLHPT